MSIHGHKSHRRHPDAERLVFQTGHVFWEISPKNGTWAIFPGLADTPKDRRPLFSGFIESQDGDGPMGQQLRRLAHAFDDAVAQSADQIKTG